MDIADYRGWITAYGNRSREAVMIGYRLLIEALQILYFLIRLIKTNEIRMTGNFKFVESITKAPGSHPALRLPFLMSIPLADCSTDTSPCSFRLNPAASWPYPPSAETE